MTDIPQWAAQKADHLAADEFCHQSMNKAEMFRTALARLIAKTMPSQSEREEWARIAQQAYTALGYDRGEDAQNDARKALAKYLPVDPLVEAVEATFELGYCESNAIWAVRFRTEMFKRGLEVAPVREVGHD